MTDTETLDLTPAEVEEKADEMTLILDQIEDEQEREEAKQMLMDTHGVDPDTRLAITDAKPDETETETETSGEVQSAKESAAAESKADSGTEKVAETEKGEANDPELEALKQQLAEATARITELESGSENVDDSLFQERADEAMAEEVAALAAEREEALAKIETYRENYGDEAADELARTMEEKFEAKEHALDVAWQDIYDAEKAEHDDQVRASSQIMQDINQVPELKQWYDDAAQNNKPRMWDLAANVDRYLQEDDAWKGKTQVERFQEVVNRVKIASGEQSGTPPTPKETKSTKQAIDEAISKDASKVDQPQTLSDLPGSISGDSINSLNDISMSNLAALSVDDLMKMGEQLQ